ncbi:restriction endonuclease subunit S [Commensalibacter sp. ESL0382]|uniref:restriction endonuclease subunit S n=1 Tax=Commensalibacter sp. ESL0382 TaxID=2676445 RepID=UPI0012D96B50|nr:restriction endonuclease subunit S [Commensalibacter sp. ESL0382]MUG34097.1 restriction endonuclease subunit S [Commensalibacter sp. ESL0382]
MAQFKAYPKYKDSGVEWLGEVPEHWKISNIKRSTYLKGRVGWKGLTSNEFEVNSFAYLVTGTDFKQKYVNWSSCYQINESRYEDDPYIQLKNGDLLMTKDGTIGKLAIVKNLNKSACLNSGIFLIRPEKYYLTEFMYWVLNSNAFNLFFVMNTIGSTILHLYQNVFERFVFSYPNFKEQERIVSYLNLETAKIDALIAKQEKLIELLEEQRKSVISHAVTKGLDPNAPMKNSGIEWLGEVPEHWEERKIKFVSKLINKKTSNKINPVALENIEGWTSKFIETELGYEGDAVCFKENDILFGKLRPYLAKVFLAHNNGEAVGDIYVLRPNSLIVPEFLKFLMISNKFIDYVNSSTNGTKMPRANWDFIGSIIFFLPQIDEQLSIVNEIFLKNEQIEITIIKQKRLIEKLKEYRASVISHAVTGKIDVRELVA